MVNPCETCGACCEGCNFYGVDPCDAPHVPREFYGVEPGQERPGMFTVPRPLTLPPRQGRRCVALAGDVGINAHCTLYPTATSPDRRPWVCGATPPGSYLCCITRDRAKMPMLDAVPWPVPSWSFRGGWKPGTWQIGGIPIANDSQVWRAWMDHLRDSLDKNWPKLAPLHAAGTEGG